MRVAFWIFAANFFVLMQLGAKHVENPYIQLGQVCTAIYFLWFIVIVPAVGIIENTLADLATLPEPSYANSRQASLATA